MSASLAVFPILSVLPGIGVGPIRFGMTQEEIEEILGKPTVPAELDKSGDLLMTYDDLCLSLFLGHEDGFRLEILEIEACNKYRLFGKNIRELGEDDLLDVSELAGISLTAKFEEDEYVWTDEEEYITFYLEHGFVTGLSLVVPSDCSDEPVWSYP